jgi:VanZ family protein
VIARSSIRRSADEPVSRSAARRAASLWAFFLLALTSWPSPPEVPVLSGLPSIDKVVHSLLYGVFGWLVFRAVRWPGRPGFTCSRALAIVGALAVFGVADETHQAFIPGRSMEGRDAVMDVAGAALGTLVAGWTERRRKRAAAD